MSAKPLRGKLILSLALNVPGPVAAREWQKLGAKIIKVEPPEGDPLNHYYPAWYKELTRGQKILTLNLKEPKDKKKFFQLLAKSNLLLSASRPQALEKLGLAWKNVKHFSKLRHLLVLGYPRPKENEAGHDLTYLAEAALLQPPEMPKTLYADLMGSMQLVSAGLVLLLEKKPKQRQLELAIADAAKILLEPYHHGLTKKGGVLSGSNPFYKIYSTKSGFVALAALEPHFQKRFLEECSGVKNNNFADLFLTKTAKDWEAWAQAHDIPLKEVKEGELYAN